MRRYLTSTFGSLAIWNYRLYFIGQNLSVTGNWMQRLAQGWLVLDITGSPVLLGTTIAVQQVPSLIFAPLGGLVADRLNKRKVLLITQAVAVIPAATLALLVGLDMVTVWVVMLLALALGAIEAIDTPTRHTFVTEMVGLPLLPNAMALNSITQNLGKIVGPAIGGILIAWFGLPFTFLANSLSYLATIAALLLMRPWELNPAPAVPRARRQVRDAIAHVRARPTLRAPLILAAVTGLFVYNWQVMVPVLASDGLHGDARTAGLLFGAMGLGATVGGLLLAGSLRATMRSLVGYGLVMGILVGSIGLSQNLIVSLVILFFIGVCNIAFRSVAASAVQLLAEPSMRGRVVSLLVVAFNGTSPLGAPLMGWMSQSVGVWFAMLVAGIGTVSAAIWTWWYLRLHAGVRADWGSG